MYFELPRKSGILLVVNTIICTFTLHKGWTAIFSPCILALISIPGVVMATNIAMQYSPKWQHAGRKCSLRRSLNCTDVCTLTSVQYKWMEQLHKYVALHWNTTNPSITKEKGMRDRSLPDGGRGEETTEAGWITNHAVCRDKSGGSYRWLLGSKRRAAHCKHQSIWFDPVQMFGTVTEISEKNLTNLRLVTLFIKKKKNNSILVPFFLVLFCS